MSEANAVLVECHVNNVENFIDCHITTQQINSSNATAGKKTPGSITRHNFQQSKGNLLKEMECKIHYIRQERTG